MPNHVAATDRHVHQSADQRPALGGSRQHLGEEITIYPYINETIISGGPRMKAGRSMLLTQ